MRWFVIWILVLAMPMASAAELTDLAGRRVVLPGTVRRISCIHSTPSHLLWRLAPTLQISIDTQFRDRLQTLPEAEVARLLSLPLTGIYRGGINREEMLSLRPDVIISLSKDPNLDREQVDFAAPVVAISKDSLADYVASLRLVGRLVGNPEEGDRLAAYWEEAIARVATAVDGIPQPDRPKVYYA